MNISTKTRELLNDESLIFRRDMWLDKLHRLFNGEKQTNIFAIKGICGSSGDNNLIFENPEKWVVEVLESLAENVDKCRNDMMFVPPCIESALMGVHFIDKLLGCDVYFKDEQWYNNYLKTSVGTLQKPNLETNELWNIAKRVALEFVRQDVKLPLFGLPTIASTLNIAVNLYGQEILMETLAEPENADHDYKIINELLVEIHEWYRVNIPMQQLQPVVSMERTQPPGYGQICGCTSQLISDEIYSQHIATLDNTLLGVYPKGGMIHLCGSHTHLIDTFKSMPNLKSIQLNDRAAKDLELYYNGLREDQIIYLNPCEGMTAKAALEITGNNRIIIVENIGI